MDFKLICTICTDPLTGLDSVYSTSCGHLYHFVCMQQWQARSTSCPQCRYYNPGTHRIYLNFESDVNDDVRSSSNRYTDLETDLNDDSLAYQLKRSEKEFLSLQAQFNKKDDEICQLKDELELLSIVNESLRMDVDRKAVQIKDLQRDLNEFRGVPIPGKISAPVIETKKQKPQPQANVPNIHDLFIHAKQLRDYGFKKVYKFKGKVFVRYEKFSPAIRIFSYDQIDDLIEEYEESGEETEEEYSSEENSYAYDPY